jgi:glutamine synthetase adenylyltransferase
MLTDYMFLRTLESRLAMVRRRPETHLPDERSELAKLAWRMGYKDTPAGGAVETLIEEVKYHLRSAKEMFDKIVRA